MTIEVSLFRVDEFVQFDEFYEKLMVQIKWLDEYKITLIWWKITGTY